MKLKVEKSINNRSINGERFEHENKNDEVQFVLCDSFENHRLETCKNSNWVGWKLNALKLAENQLQITHYTVCIKINATHFQCAITVLYSF